MEKELIEVVIYKDNKGVKLPLLSKEHFLEKIAKVIEKVNVKKYLEWYGEESHIEHFTEEEWKFARKEFKLMAEEIYKDLIEDNKMNENEEKILIFKVKNPCSDNCEIKDIQSCKTCNVKKRYDEAMSYDTAIEKMCQALEKFRTQLLADKEHLPLFSDKMAMKEILNALLEDK